MSMGTGLGCEIAITPSDIILRNTETDTLQKDLFVYTQRESGAVDGITPADLNIAMIVTGNETQNDVLTVGTKNDTLVAGNGNDRLEGGLGRDVMTGRNGFDVFAVSTALGRSNVDTITDFQPGQDKIELSSAIFTAIAPGILANGAFQIGQVAQTAQAHILFDPKSGSFSYDADGNGAAAAQMFAVLPTGIQLTNADFVVA